MALERIGFLGLGMMGAPMAKNLATKGFQVVVWNRTKSRALALGDARIAIADSPADVVKRVDAWCYCLSDPAAVEEVSFGMQGTLEEARPGQAFIDFSTGSVELAQRLGDACAKKGVAFSDAPVTGSVLGAEQGKLVVMAGCSHGTFEALRPIFAAVGEKAIHCGPVGAGSQVKLAGNALLASMLQGFSEGALSVAKAGFDPYKFYEVVQASGYRSPYFDFKGKAVLDGDRTVFFTIDLMHKDLTLMTESAAKRRVPAPLAGALREVYNLARASGRGSHDITDAIGVFEDISGTSISGKKIEP